MLRHVRRLLVLLLPASFVLSCTELPQTREPGTMGTLNVEALPSRDTVPLSWGRLVAVTSDALDANLTLLWYEDEAGSVRVVAYNHVTQRLGANARLIPRG